MSIQKSDALRFAEILKAWAEGKTIQCRSASDDSWYDLSAGQLFMNADVDSYRIAPELVRLHVVTRKPTGLGPPLLSACKDDGLADRLAAGWVVVYSVDVPSDEFENLGLTERKSNDPKEALPTWDLIQHLKRQRAFSRKTFGPDARTAGVCDHIRKELKEIEANPTDLMEWVDVILLALDGAWRAGYEPADIASAISQKQARNEARTWPDWRTADPNKAIEHDRGSDNGKA